MKIWIEAARPKTLTAAVVPIAVGTALAWAAGYAVRWHLSVFALLSALFIQIGTNLVNDAIDFKKGTDNEKRIGPRRVTQSGLLSPRTVMMGAFACLALASLFAIPLIWQGGWVILGIGIFSLIFAYGYTGGPFPLAYLGLGEIFVLLFFGFAAVIGVYYLHTDHIDWRPLVGGFQVGGLATVLLCINNLRDRAGDAENGKKTLAVRFGVTFSRIEIAVFAIAPLLVGFYWIQYGYLGATILPLLALPLAFRITRQVATTEPGPAYNGFLAQGGMLQLLFGILFSLGCLLPWGRS